MQRKQTSFSAGCTNNDRHSSARPASSDTEEKGRIEEITERGNTEENGRKREVEVQERKMRNKIGKKVVLGVLGKSRQTGISLAVPSSLAISQNTSRWGYCPEK